MQGCLACDLTSNRRDLPGGRIYATTHWVVEHCIGPLPAGTLIIKPLRHCVHFWELTDAEAAELGPLLHTVTGIINDLLQPDQIYICQWSHAGWTPGHIHFVLQPSWNHYKDKYRNPGPFMQYEMYLADEPPPKQEVEAFCEKARDKFAAIATTNE